MFKLLNIVFLNLLTIFFYLLIFNRYCENSFEFTKRTSKLKSKKVKGETTGF